MYGNVSGLLVSVHGDTSGSGFSAWGHVGGFSAWGHGGGFSAWGHGSGFSAWGHGSGFSAWGHGSGFNAWGCIGAVSYTHLRAHETA